MAALRLGFARHQAGEFTLAIAQYRRAISIDPVLGDAYYLYGIAAHALTSHLTNRMFGRAYAIDPARLDFITGLAKILMDGRDYVPAQRLARRALAVEPAQIELRNVLRSIGSILFARAQGRADPDFLGVTYDDLGPRLVPNPYAKRLREWTEPFLAQMVRPRFALDVGCGTGPVGDEFHSLVDVIVGCDMSAKSLRVASSKKRYQRLVRADILDFLRAERHESYDLVTAAGSFCYFGDLGELVELAHRLLKPGGILAFTIFRSERAEPERDVAKEVYGIFKHSQTYIESVAARAHFEIVAMGRDLKIFDEGKRDIIDDLYVLRKLF